jgi:hypothetical protein
MKVSIFAGIKIVLILEMLAVVGSADPYYGLVVGRNPYSISYPTDSCCGYSCCDCYIEEPADCDDGNPCTFDSCTPNGCVHKPVNCDDGDPCTVDSCSSNGCVHEPVNCDDGDPCTADSCTSDGCVHEPVFCKENMHLGVDAWYGEYWFTEIFKPKWPQRV